MFYFIIGFLIMLSLINAEDKIEDYIREQKIRDRENY